VVRPRLLLTAAATSLALAGCGLAGDAGGGGSTSEPADPAVASTDEAGFTNPVQPTNFPDPHVVSDGSGGYIAFATNGNAMNVQTALSDDLVTWRQGSDALPQLPSWSTPGKVWAPEAIEWQDGTYRLYYTTALTGENRQCLSVAVAEEAVGPYEDSSTEPLVCEIDEGGSIDATPFVDTDGTAWLYWKNDGNHIGIESTIRVAPLSADGLAVEAEPTVVLEQDQPWEGMLVEGPSLWEHEGTYHLFYSGNGYWTDQYAVGHAVGPGPTGPFTKTPEPVLTTNEVAAGPGHNSLIEVEDRVWMVYHAWVPGAVGDESQGRQMWLSQVAFEEDGAVEVEPPTVDHREAPESAD
jgi:beta-xylosidase